MNLHETETPCLIVDMKKVKRNIERLHRRLARFDLQLRVHGKTARNIGLVRMALAGQPEAVTVSTLSEAEYFFTHGITDITYAVGITPSKLERVAGLMESGADIRITLDTPEQALEAAAAGKSMQADFRFLIEIDCDGMRAGITPNDPALIEIASLARDMEGIELAGVLTHAGGSYHCSSTSGITAIAERERGAVLAAAEILRAGGFSCPVVSVGSTPTAFFAENLDGVTEVRAGVFIFQDLVMASLGVCSIGDIALSVLSSITGYQKDRGWLITDAGWMALSNSRAEKGREGFGIPLDIGGSVIGDFAVSAVSQEHGIISSPSGQPVDYRSSGIGDRVRILPNHACSTAAMHDFYYTVDGGEEITGRLERIRGW